MQQISSTLYKYPILEFPYFFY